MTNKYNKKTIKINHPYDSRRFKHVSIDTFAKVSTVKRQTIQRWFNGEQKMNQDTLQLVTMYVFGLLPNIFDDRRWLTFSFAENKIYTPNGNSFNINALEGFSFTYELNRELKHCIKKLKAKYESREAPEPRNTAEIFDISDYLFKPDSNQS